MTNTTTELAQEYRLVEAQVREKYKDVFDQIEAELREKWSTVWSEMGHDPARIQVKVAPRIRVELDDREGVWELQKGGEVPHWYTFPIYKENAMTEKGSDEVKTVKESWEDEFDNRFDVLFDHYPYDEAIGMERTPEPAEIKEFIRSLLCKEGQKEHHLG